MSVKFKSYYVNIISLPETALGTAWKTFRKFQNSMLNQGIRTSFEITGIITVIFVIQSLIVHLHYPTLRPISIKYGQNQWEFASVSV